MASSDVSKNFVCAEMSEDSKKCKNKKKSKKRKKEKLKNNKTRMKYEEWLIDDCFEPDIFTQTPEARKKKKKKKHLLKLDEGVPLQQTKTKKLKLLKRSKKRKDSGHAADTHQLESGIVSAEQEHMQPTSVQGHKSSGLKGKACDKKKVAFKLSPEEIRPKTPPVLRDSFETQPCSTNNLPSLNTASSGDSGQSKPSVDENALASQSTSEDINSQDLFITQKCFSEPSTDISSSASTDDALALPAHQHSVSHTSLEQEPSSKPTADASTQTEDTFSFPKLATSLEFHHQRTLSPCTEEPIDLSRRTGSRQLEQDGRPVHDQTVDVTSSEDSDTLSKGKGDLSQLKVVQTKLNESFFFRFKGNDSPKPASPLMKLTKRMGKRMKK